MKNKTLKKILFLDIETSPNLAYVWGKYEQDVIAFEKEWYIMSFAYRWDNGKTQCLSLPDFPAYKKNKEDDKALVSLIWTILDQADIVVAHNGDKFDLRKINARFIAHGLTPCKPYKTVDTLKVARKYFNFNSNKLDDLCKTFNIGMKLDTQGFKTWLGCMSGDLSSWHTMTKYNKHDVELLYKLYYKLLPWIDSHPNMNLLAETADKCPKCLSSKIQNRGFGINATTRYQRIHCQSCGGWARKALSEVARV
jgi:DNA polymerase elongation subunit (family B)